MPRLRAILFNTHAALSLLLFLAMCALWIRSYYVRDLIEPH